MRLSLPRGSVVSAMLLLALAGTASAQGFRGIFARTPYDAIAVGDAGAVYRTLDGGVNWTSHALGAPTLQLRHVAARGNTMVIVGEGGAIWKSVDAGTNWTQTTLPGQPFLRGLAMPSDAVWFACGSNGSIVRTVDGGATWTPLVSGTNAVLYSLCFTDAQHGWAAGDFGVLLATSDGGDTWSQVFLGTLNELVSVDQRGATVWVVGLDATAFRSTDGGGTFAPVNLHLDARADLRVVSMRSPDTLWVAGGGGFIRASTDGGATWTFAQHPLHGEIADLSTSGPGLYACSSKNLALVASLDHGATWHLPTGATLSRTWGSSPKYSFGGSARGNGFALNPVYKSTIYCGLGAGVVRSRNDGDTWSTAATFPSGYIKCNAFVVSPKDSNLWLAALSGTSVGDRLYRTTDGGATWTPTLIHDFGEYGIPLEMDPDHPDTVLFGGELNVNGTPFAPLQRSTDFGATWNAVPTAVFRSPCDLVVVPGSSNVVIVNDGVTGIGRGRHFKSTDGGNTFTVTDSTPAGTSELPGLACSRLRPNQVLSTGWINGGVTRSIDGGSSWTTVDNTTQPWDIDISRDDPNVVAFAQYSNSNGPPLAYISLDGGLSFSSIPLPLTLFNNNYGMYCRDRATILAEQSSGIWKLQNNYSYTPASSAQSLQLVSPSGGESWAGGTVHAVQWTATNVIEARIEYRRSPSDPWQLIADVPGYPGHYDWTVPWDGTTEAELRISDLWDSSPIATSGMFTILAPRVSETPAALDFGTLNAGDVAVLPLTFQNTGTAALQIGSIATTANEFAVGRASLTLAPGEQDTVGVWFLPQWGGAFADTVTIASNDTLHTPLRIPVVGRAIGPMVQLLSPNGGETWPAGSLQNITWADSLVAFVDIEYRVSPDSAWVPIVTGLSSDPPSCPWVLPMIASQHVEIRIYNEDGTPIDFSDAPFGIMRSYYAATPETLTLAPAGMGSVSHAGFQLTNAGNLPLTLSAVSSSNPDFWVGRTSLVIPPESSDTLGVYFSPTSFGVQTAQIGITSDDPGAPHALVAVGDGEEALAVDPNMEPGTGAAFALLQNRPNPFVAATVIQYTLPRDARVSLEVFDLRGERVATLASGAESAGVHRVTFGRGGATHGLGGGPLAAGVYFYRLRAGSLAATRRMLLVP